MAHGWEGRAAAEPYPLPELRACLEMGLIRLKSAIQRYRKEPGAPMNSYDWYRRSAQHDGVIHISPVDVPVSKAGGVWYVDNTNFKRALLAHRARRAVVARATRDIERGKILRGNGDTVEVEGGFYEVHGSFRLEVSDYERQRHRSYGTWYCNRCNKPARTKHEKPECHRCADWSGCGRDCTLSEVRCDDCGRVLRL